jgi:hypothetical protein
MKTPTNTEQLAKDNPGAILAEGIIRGGSGMIEAMEARGQAELINSAVLPAEGSAGSVWEKIGVRFGAPVDGDPIFRHVELPAGWKKVATDHSMHSHLVDDKGRVRARIFYKAAFYDRSASIHLARRFEATYEPEGGWDAPYEAPVFAIVRDCDREIWRSPAPYNASGEPGSSSWVPRSEGATLAAAAWLNEHWPNWRDVTAYWDEPAAEVSP